MEPEQTPLAVIGGGNMARAILTAPASAALLAGRCVVAEPLAEKRPDFELAVPTAADALAWVRAHEPVPGVGQVLLAVKPQLLADVARELAPILAAEDQGRVVITILAGTPSAKVRAALAPAVRVVRAMPNTPARIARGITAVCLGDGARQGDDTFARALFEGVGRVVDLPESMLDAFTALAGSGPAYVFYLAEAMVEAACALGFEREQAIAIVRETVSGSGELMRSSPEPPRALRAAVTSKGGTTAAATDVLDQAGVMDAFIRAIHAARHRGVELAKD